MEFIMGLLGIMMVNIILSGDNAVVIAMASRSLPSKQQKLAIFWGSAGAIVLRIALTVIAVLLLQIPYLQCLGGLLLIWIGFDRIGLLRFQPDEVRADNLVRLVRSGHRAQIMMSQDRHCGWLGKFARQLTPAELAHIETQRAAGTWPPPYTYLFTDFVPMLRERGLGEAEIASILEDNPRRFFAGKQGHAASAPRRVCTRMAAKAAGVIPRIRAASARVAGRARSSRSTISLERPGTAR